MPPAKKKTTRRKFTRKVAPSTKMYVKTMISKARETKSHAVYYNVGQELVSAGTLYRLTTINQGDGAVSERIGDHLDLRRLEFRAMINGQAAATGGIVQNARIIIFKWKTDDNADAPAMSKLLDHTDYYKSPYVHELEDRKKFTILYDRNHCLGHVPVSGLAKALSLKLVRNLGSIKFDTAGANGTGHIYIAYMSNSPTGVNTPYMTWDSFVQYKD